MILQTRTRDCLASICGQYISVEQIPNCNVIGVGAKMMENEKKKTTIVSLKDT